jgi:hypothetical protein
MGQYERHRVDNDQPPGERISFRGSMPILEICAEKEQDARHPAVSPIWAPALVSMLILLFSLGFQTPWRLG